MDRRRLASVVVLLAAVSALPRAFRLGSQPLWTDEANCLAIAQVRTTSLWHALEHDCSPPLYYLLLRAVVGQTPTEARVRALSAAFGMVTPPIVAWCGLRALGPPGFVAGVLLAVSPLHVWHSQEARMYSMVSLLGALLACFVASSGGCSRALVAIVACDVLLLWTHHFSLFAVVASFLVLASRGVPRRRLLVMAAAVALGWSFAAVLLWRQVFLFRTGTWLSPPSWDAPLRSVGLWLAGVEADAHSRVAGVPLGVMLAAVGAAPLAWRGVKSPVGRTMATLCGATLALSWVVSRFVPALVPGRYDVVVMPAFLLVLAAGYGASSRMLRVVSLGALLGSALLGLHHYFTAYEKGAVRDLVRVVEACERPGDAIVVVPEIEAPVVRYYYRGSLPVLVPPRFGTVERVDYARYEERWADDEEARSLADRCWDLVPEGGRIYLFYSPYRGTVHFKGRLMHNARYRRIARRVTGSGSVELALLERAGADSSATSPPCTPP